MSPKMEVGDTGAWAAMNSDVSERTSMVALGDQPKFGQSVSLLPGQRPIPSTVPQARRRRSALKPSTPTVGLLAPSPPKQTPSSISVNARSSSVVAPRSGNSPCMLFSQADLRLPRTAPLSARRCNSNVAVERRNGPRTFDFGPPSCASAESKLSGQSDSAWYFRSPRSGGVVGVSCSSSPPRLPALKTNVGHSRRASTGGRLEMHEVQDTSPSSFARSTTAMHAEGTLSTGYSKEGEPHSGAEDSSRITRVASTGGVGESTTKPEAEVRRQTLDSVSLREKLVFPVPGDASEREGGDERAQEHHDSKAESPFRCSNADISTGNVNQKKNKTRRSLSGSYKGMSVAEFADKVAALAADVAGVFGNKSPQPPECGPCGVE